MQRAKPIVPLGAIGIYEEILCTFLNEKLLLFVCLDENISKSGKHFCSPLWFDTCAYKVLRRLFYLVAIVPSAEENCIDLKV